MPIARRALFAPVLILAAVLSTGCVTEGVLKEQDLVGVWTWNEESFIHADRQLARSSFINGRATAIQSKQGISRLDAIAQASSLWESGAGDDLLSPPTMWIQHSSPVLHVHADGTATLILREAATGTIDPVEFIPVRQAVHGVWTFSHQLPCGAHRFQFRESIQTHSDCELWALFYPATKRSSASFVVEQVQGPLWNYLNESRLNWKDIKFTYYGPENPQWPNVVHALENTADE